ncbi:hypothetical protein C8R43DRAFT_941224 [Mycena crocata]|nr:hypothetical protein C8R43DRAFT_941224 [Mycena crocata]
MLIGVTTLELEEIQHSMPQCLRNSIKELYIQWPPHRISDLAAFVSKFNALDTLASCPYSQDEIPETIHCLVPPPPSIRQLVLWRSDREDHIAPAMLKWFTDLHSGTIDSIDPGGLPFESPVEFAAFLTRFGSNITRIRFSFEEDEDEIQFLRLGHAYCAALPQLKFIEIEFLGEAFAYSLADKSFLRIIELLPKIVALLSPSIEEIILTVGTDPLHCEDGLGTIDWPQLDRSLTGSQYPLLKKLKVQIPGFGADEINQHLKDLWLKECWKSMFTVERMEGITVIADVMTHWVALFLASLPGDQDIWVLHQEVEAAWEELRSGRAVQSLVCFRGRAIFRSARSFERFEDAGKHTIVIVSCWVDELPGPLYVPLGRTPHYSKPERPPVEEQAGPAAPNTTHDPPTPIPQAHSRTLMPREDRVCSGVKSRQPNSETGLGEEANMKAPDVRDGLMLVVRLFGLAECTAEADDRGFVVHIGEMRDRMDRDGGENLCHDTSQVVFGSRAATEAEVAERRADVEEFAGSDGNKESRDLGVRVHPVSGVVFIRIGSWNGLLEPQGVQASSIARKTSKLVKDSKVKPVRDLHGRGVASVHRRFLREESRLRRDHPHNSNRTGWSAKDRKVSPEGCALARKNSPPLRGPPGIGYDLNAAELGGRMLQM